MKLIFCLLAVFIISSVSFAQSVSLRGQVTDQIGGTFAFGGGDAPVLDSNNQPVSDSSGKLLLAPITSIERYRRTLLFQKLGFTPSRIRELGGGATQFSINAGTRCCRRVSSTLDYSWATTGACDPISR